MNKLLSIFEREKGLSNNISYDFALARLCVPKEDSWRGITPSNYCADYNPEPPILAAKFSSCHNYKHILAIANEDGKIALHNTKKQNTENKEKALEGQQCHYNVVFDLEWAPGQMKFVSASGDHTARLWDVTESEIKVSRTYMGHTRSVKTAAFRKNDPAVFATGGRDGAILIWDTRAQLNLDLPPRADNCIYSGHVGGLSTPVSQRKKTRNTPKLGSNTTSSSITGLVFQNDNTLVSCGAGDGTIKVWDLRRNYSTHRREPLPKHGLPYAGSHTYKGFTYLLCDEAGTKLYANCMDNTIYSYNLNSYSTKPMERYVGFRNSTFYIKSCLSPDGNYLCSGSSDEKAYIWNLKNPQPLLTLNGHTVEVTCVAWSAATDQPIVTCSDDARHKVWHVGPEKVAEDEKINYRGHTVVCNDYYTEQYGNPNLLKKHLQGLDRTPRSLKRIVEENEKTPSSVEKLSTKRTFSELDVNPSDTYFGSDQKRPHLEARGRRLFSPSTSNSSNSYFSSNLVSNEYQLKPGLKIKLSPVLDHRDDSNQENNSVSPENQQVNINPKSPLTERINFNLKSPQSILSPSTSSMQQHSLSTIFSPTSNLPNYVIDGDAPHLSLMSPKRKLKSKVDWLTKIRKQKLMSTPRSTLNEKLFGSNTTISSTYCDNDNNINECLLSPRLQNVKDYDSPKINKRRNSGTIDGPLSKTPNRNCRETTILKFFSTISSSPTQSNMPSAASSQKSTNYINNINSICYLLVSALLVCLGATFIILACAVPEHKKFWPFFVFIFYPLSVLPLFIAKRRNSDYTGSNPNSCVEFALFLTAGIIYSTFALPIVLAKSGAIDPIASYLTMAGNVVIYLTILGHAMREADEGYGGMF